MLKFSNSASRIADRSISSFSFTISLRRRQQRTLFSTKTQHANPRKTHSQTQLSDIFQSHLSQLQANYLKTLPTHSIISYTQILYFIYLFINIFYNLFQHNKRLNATTSSLPLPKPPHRFNAKTHTPQLNKSKNHSITF